MKILICSSIYPPDVGSEALIAKKLFLSYTKTVNWTYVATYRWERAFPPIVRNAVFFARIIPRILWADVVIALDFLYCGFPTVFFAKILKKKHVVVVGHDSLWESYVERTGEKIKLEDFYPKIKSGEIKLSRKEKIKKYFIGQTLSLSKATVFSSVWLRDILAKGYKFDIEKTTISKVPFTKKLIEKQAKTKSRKEYAKEYTDDEENDEKIVVGGSRTLGHKQIDELKNVWGEMDTIDTAHFKLDTVRVIYDSFLEKLEKCHAFVSFSMGDSVSMSAVHALERGKPVVMTNNTGMREFFGDAIVYADTNDKESMKTALRHIFDADLYEKQVEKIKALKIKYSWDDYALDLMTFLIKSNRS